jgi:glucose-6-phosphate 1-dehydrogenase
MTAARGPQPADGLVLFGVSGDLARRKLLPALYQMTVRGQLNLPVIGVAASDWDDEQVAARPPPRRCRTPTWLCLPR